MSGPLEGMRVIDCGHWVQGPTAGAMLGDMGAEVIKVEDCKRGDPVRGMQVWAGRHAGAKRNFVSEYVNRNKRALALDLEKEIGREIIYKLIEKADVFIQNFRLGVPERIGLDYGTLSQRNPRLIYAQGSGWGPKGPISTDPAMDICGWARSGGLYQFGGEEMPPLMHKGGIGDHLAGMTIVGGILAAIYARDRQGVGQLVDVSLLGSLIAFQGSTVNYALLHEEELPRRARETVRNPLWNLYKCADNKWIVLAMMQADRYWDTLCKIMGIEALQKDPRFENMEVRGDHGEELVTLFDRVFATKPRDEWVRLFRQEGIVHSPVFTISEVIVDPQALANGYITEFDHPTFGHVKAVGSPYNFSKTPATIKFAAPEHGQHTEEILLELGYSWENIAEFKDQGVIP